MRFRPLAVVVLLAWCCTTEGGSTSDPAADATDTQSSDTTGETPPDVCTTACGDISSSSNDACLGVVCTTPGLCEVGPGTCVEGACVYAPDDGGNCDDGDACTADERCSGRECIGAPIVCDDPPPANCQNGTALFVWASPGQCLDGACTYPTTLVDCGSGCEDGACVGDPCKGVICDEPPTPCHESVGVCSSGTCQSSQSNQRERRLPERTRQHRAAPWHRRP